MTINLQRSRFSRQVLPLEHALLDGFNFQSTGGSARGLLKAYGRAATNAKLISMEMQLLSQEFFHMDSPVVQLPPCDLRLADDALAMQATINENLQVAASQLAAAWDCSRIGRIEMLARNACRFTYYDFVDQGGILNRTYDVAKHQHDLASARFHRAEAVNIEIPERAKLMLARLHYLKPYARIVTGVEVATGTEQSESFQERTALGRALDTTVDATARGAKAAGRGARRVSKSVTTRGVVLGGLALGGLAAAGMALSSLAAVAIADPALIIGDRVLYGWD